MVFTLAWALQCAVETLLGALRASCILMSLVSKVILRQIIDCITSYLCSPLSDFHHQTVVGLFQKRALLMLEQPEVDSEGHIPELPATHLR